MKKALKLLSILLATCAAAHAQVAPAAIAGPASFGYSLRYSQSAEFGEDLGNAQTAIASGGLNYRSGSERLPFSVNYGAGYTFTLAGPAYSTGLFQRLYIAQGLMGRRWAFTVGDSVSYLPEAPITGFSGVPGSGEPIGSPNPSPPTDQSILTVRTRSVDNFVNAGFSDKPTFATSFNANYGYGILRYPDGNGINLDSEVLGGGVSQRLNARMSLTGGYSYSHFGYPDFSFAFKSNSVFGGFNRVWNRQFTSTVSGGPQWTSSNDSTFVPSSINFGISTATSMRFRSYSGSVRYLRGVSGGAGYLLGARSDVVSANIGRPLGRESLTIGLEGSYSRISTLNNSGSINATFVGVEAGRRIGQHASASLSYTVIEQGSSAVLPSNTLSHPLQVVSFGITYSPRSTRIIR